MSRTILLIELEEEIKYPLYILHETFETLSFT